jgi:gluconolactonase
MKPPGPEFVADPYEVIDERFASVQGDSRLERLFDGCRWAEGPVYVPAGRYLLFSDIPNDRIMRWDECTGVVGVFRAPSRHTNGGMLDREGRLVSCEHSGRRVTRTEHDGSLTVIADRFEGKRLNSPNDVVVKSDGSVWFTDPSYGIDSDYEGDRAESEIGGCHVYRVDPSDGACRMVADDFVRPNGLAFSADERRLFIADTRLNHIRVFDVAGDGTLSNSREFAQCSAGRFDGLRFDEDGRLWAAAGDGVHCFAADGTLIGKIRVPDPAVSNVVFGGPKRNRLFICATTAIYSLHLHANGLPRPGTAGGPA